MEQLLGEALKGLVAAGPVSIILFLVLKNLWSAYHDLRKEHKELQEQVLLILKNALTEDDDHGK